MTISKLRPTTSSRRHVILVNKNNLSKSRAKKKLLKKKSSTGGRNNIGRTTITGRFKGHKKRYRLVDFKRTNKDTGIVNSIEYDPNRSANIALIRYKNNHYSYIIAHHKMKIGQKIKSEGNIKLGICTKLHEIPIGCFLHNIESKSGRGGQVTRAAGCFSILISKDSFNGYIKMSSGEIKTFSLSCLASIGIVSNINNSKVNYGKAGRKRWKGFNSKVRGVAMNPIDHPHGGGEGKTSGGRHPVNKNSKLIKGLKTRKNKRTDKFIIQSRHKSK